MKIKNTRYLKDPDGLKLAVGNLKIGNDTIILNMGPAYNCPSDRLNKCECSDVCYAKKAEKQYPDCRKYRFSQQIYWLTTDAAKIAQDIINALKKYKFRKDGKLEPLHNKIKYLRVNESGDFWSQKCVNKLDHIARELKQYSCIVTYTYTARDDLRYENCGFNVKGSGHFRGNNGACIVRKQAQIDKNKRVSGYAYVEKFDNKLRTFAICPGDCVKCDICKDSNGLNVVFPEH